jgi:predicted SprT family Zn-dependent metalloprotease
MQVERSAAKERSLPTEQELVELYDGINRTYWEGKLPGARVEWSNRLRIAGQCFPDAHSPRIVLSRHYHEHFPEDLEGTIKHEMIHLRYKKHGKRFKAEAKRVGALLHTREYPGLRRKPLYVYTCPACQREYVYRRKVKGVACGYCCKGWYQSKYRLILKRDLREHPRGEEQLEFTWGPSIR